MAESVTAPPLPGIGLEHSGGPVGPTAKYVVNLGPKFPFKISEEGVVRRSRYLADTRAQYVWETNAQRGKHARRVVLGPPYRARRLGDTAAGHVPNSSQ